LVCRSKKNHVLLFLIGQSLFQRYRHISTLRTLPNTMPLSYRRDYCILVRIVKGNTSYSLPGGERVCGLDVHIMISDSGHLDFELPDTHPRDIHGRKPMADYSCCS